MYEAPRLVKYGQFRDLTLQTQTCMTTPPYTGKTAATFDSIFPVGQTNDGCPEVRS